METILTAAPKFTMATTLLCIQETINICFNVICMASEGVGTLVGTAPAVMLPIHEGTNRLICP
jgi:hypothetical protein